MIDYPNKLDIIFEKLSLFNIKPIIIGGYIRDKLLKLDSKDIDIELYGIDSLQSLENILNEFGSLSSVGKSFGVCKLKYEELDIDFSLPRSDNKVGSGHRGFEVATNKNLDFKTATSRRDFTINAIGYDAQSKTLLDPFYGRDDLQAKILRAVDIKKFDEDPLRVLRGVQFSTRFNLEFDPELFIKCKNMIKAGALCELPPERIFEEFKKMLLKSKKPSDGFLLLKKLGAFCFFDELAALSNVLFEKSIRSLDFLASEKIEDDKKRLSLMLALACKEFSQEKIDSFLNKLTQETKLRNEIKKLVSLSKDIAINDCSNYDVYALAKEIEIKTFLLYLDAAYLGQKQKELQLCKAKAKSLNVYTEAMPPLLQGKDLISLGHQPSKEFSKILDAVYKAQMRELFSTKEEAITWAAKNLLV